jgi:hypothetical protein
MCAKSKAIDKFKVFKLAVKNYLNKTIKIFHSDSAGKLTKGPMRQFLESSGILIGSTNPDAPQQNGVAERTNYTIASMVCTMLLNADMCDWFWPLAAQTAVYIKNCILHSALPTDTTPYELWTSKKPDLSHLVPFGTHCSSCIVNTNLGKSEA